MSRKFTSEDFDYDPYLKKLFESLEDEECRVNASHNEKHKKAPKFNSKDPEVKCMYDYIPKNLLPDIHNPHEEVHGLKLPMRAVIVSPSGGGKTNLLFHLISLFSGPPQGTFYQINVITRNKDEPLYKYLEKVSDGKVVVTEGLHTTPRLDSYNKHLNSLLVFDDLVLEKNLEKVCEFYIRARKLGVSVIFISQSYFMIPKVIRTNCTYMFVLKLGGSSREVNMILSELALSVSKEELIKLYKRCTSKKFSFMLIDFESDETKRFRCGYKDVIDITVKDGGPTEKQELVEDSN